MIRIERFACGVAAFLSLTTVATLAQASLHTPAPVGAVIGAQDGVGGPPPFGGPPEGDAPPHHGGPGSPHRMPPPPPVTAATIPVEAMKSYLALTDTQFTRIRAVHTALRNEMRPPHPPQKDGSRPEPPSPEEHAARRKAADAALRKASASVIALLDGEQKTRLPILLKAFEALRAGRIPPPELRDRELSEAQWTKLAALGKDATRDAVLAILNGE